MESSDGKPAPRRHEYRTAIIDIGSNSIRLVVYAGPRRNPAVIYNEKVMAGLGAELSDTGLIGQDAMERGVRALARFKSLIEEMGVDDTICVATAAVREARNGSDFAGQVIALGFDLSILSGDEEAEAAALGVISAIPDACGIVGDMGGGSLELARIEAGEVLERTSMPLGVLRVPALRKAGELEGRVKSLLTELGWSLKKSNETIYLVGGSWRALARMDMHLSAYPLKVLHNYTMSRAGVSDLADRLENMSIDEIKAIDEVPTSRAETLKDAADMLGIVDDYIKPDRYVVSAYGLREGLLYQRMSTETRKRDPLLEPAGRFGRLQSRFGRNGASLYKWLTPLFEHEGAEHQRLLLAACHLADAGWQANPFFRAERGIEMALHGNWVGIDAPGRMMVAQSLYTSFGGGTNFFMDDSGLIPEEELSRAVCWGLAFRFAKRLSGGTDAFLEKCSVRIAEDRLELTLRPKDAHYYGEIVERRHDKLAKEMNLTASVNIA